MADIATTIISGTFAIAGSLGATANAKPPRHHIRRRPSDHN